jgi:hypothetical protein
MVRRAIAWGLIVAGANLVLATLWDLVRYERPIHGEPIVFPVMLGFTLVGAGLGEFMEFEQTHRWVPSRLSGTATVAVMLSAPWMVLEPFGRFFSTRSFALTGLALWCALMGAIVWQNTRASSTPPRNQV